MVMTAIAAHFLKSTVPIFSLSMLMRVTHDLADLALSKSVSLASHPEIPWRGIGRQTVYQPIHSHDGGK